MIKRIGLWNTAFLGDAVLTLPLIETLESNISSCQNRFLGTPWRWLSFEAHPSIAHVYEFAKGGSFAEKRAILQETASIITGNKYDLWINTHASIRSAYMSFASHAPMRISYSAPWYNKLAHTHMVDRRFNELDEIERLLELTLPLAKEHHIEQKTWPTLTLPESAHTTAAAYWEKHVNAPVVGMHPGSVWATKRWCVSGFAEVARRAVDSGAQVMLLLALVKLK